MKKYEYPHDIFKVLTHIFSKIYAFVILGSKKRMVVKWNILAVSSNLVLKPPLIQAFIKGVQTITTSGYMGNILLKGKWQSSYSWLGGETLLGSVLKFWLTSVWLTSLVCAHLMSYLCSRLEVRSVSEKLILKPIVSERVWWLCGYSILHQTFHKKRKSEIFFYRFQTCF